MNANLGQFIYHLQHGNNYFSKVSYVVLDEVD